MLVAALGGVVFLERGKLTELVEISVVDTDAKNSNQHVGLRGRNCYREARKLELLEG